MDGVVDGVTDRSIRRYRQNLREAKAFHIHLRTTDGPVDIRIGEDKQAFMLNRDTAKYDLSLGDGSRVVDLIESGASIPELKVWWDAEAEVPEEVLESSSGYKVIPTHEEDREVAQEAAERPKAKAEAVAGPARQEEKREEGRPVRVPKVREHVASTVPLLVAAYKSGARTFRKGWDSLKERDDGVLVWELAIRKQVDKHWQTVDTAIVALFTRDGVEFPAGKRQYSAVMSRRALLEQGGEVKQ